MARLFSLVVVLSVASLGKAACPDAVIEQTWWGGGQNVFAYNTGTDGAWTLELIFDMPLQAFSVIKLCTCVKSKID